MKKIRIIVAVLVLAAGMTGETKTPGGDCCNTEQWNKCVRDGFAGCCFEKGLVPEKYCCNVGPTGGGPNGVVYFKNVQGKLVEGRVKVGELAEVRSGKLTSVPVPTKKNRQDKGAGTSKNPKK